MKIQNTPAAAMPRDWPKANKAEKTAASTPVQAETGTEASANSGRPSAPPGLERVVAKFEAMAAAGKTPGQGQALDRVSRNLARYQENQALAGTPPAPTPAPGTAPVDETPAAEAPVTETPTTEAPVAETPAESPSDTAGLPAPDSTEESALALLPDSTTNPADPTTSDADTPTA